MGILSELLERKIKEEDNTQLERLEALMKDQAAALQAQYQLLTEI